MFSIRTIDEVKNFIETNFNSSIKSNLINVKPLTGGLTNFVYRLYFQDGTTLILKHFSNYLATNENLKLPAERYFVEKEALCFFGNNEKLNKNPNIRVPKLICSNDEYFSIIMEDAGENLKTISDLFKLNNTEKPDIEIISSLAKNIHYFTNYISNESGITLENNKIFENDIVWNILSSYYPNYCKNLAVEFNLEKELQPYLERLSTIVEKPQNSDSVFVFGDLRPNSILVDTDKNLIWIIDWEMARFHTPTTDMQQLFGNLWIMKQNPRLFDLNGVELLIRKLQYEYFGDEEKDWRRSCGLDGKTNFIFWVLALETLDHWEIRNQKDLVLKALQEISW